MKILVLGDTHHPFCDQKALAKVMAFAKSTQPDYIVQIGDLYDMYSFSKFSKNPGFITPDEEVERGRRDAAKMWADLHVAAPKAKLVQLSGNHDVRPVRLVHEEANTLVIMKKFVKDMMTFKGVDLVDDEHEIGDVMFMHGDNFRRVGQQATYNQMNTVVGHTHRPGVHYDTNKNGIFFELNAGWLGDKSSEAFSYRNQKKIQKMITAFGYIADGRPEVHIL